ncbi:MAG TPA: DUF4105 domain-containing protein [Gemmatimonadales bacterium]|nr:DUF4105 domain-containing protein [Gemmatimonadales bacterium]
MWSRTLRATGRFAGSAFLVGAGTGLVQAEQPSPPPRFPASPPESLTVYLMTMGPGKRVWERFGHNAIWIHDPAKGTDKAYNYGLFDLRQENFLVRFLQGRMWYWMQGFPAQSYVELYSKANRSVWIQELEMPLAAKRQLQEFLEWNERPENRFYHYDYYVDNCSTRIRDVLDRALGGRIRETTSGLMTDRTYRFHTRRLTANDPLVYTGLLLALGQPVDRPISAWEEMFLPLALREHIRGVTVDTDSGARPLVRAERTLFESTDTTPPDRPPFWLPAYLGVGLAIGGAAFALARRNPTRRAPQVSFAFCAALWALLAGLAGLVLLGLWALTDHTAAYRNENLFQVSVLALPLLWLVPWAFRNPVTRRRAFIVALLVAGLSALGMLLQLLPGFYQVNGEIIALALPVHLGVAGGLWRLTRG